MGMPDFGANLPVAELSEGGVIQIALWGVHDGTVPPLLFNSSESNAAEVKTFPTVWLNLFNCGHTKGTSQEKELFALPLWIITRPKRHKFSDLFWVTADGLSHWFSFFTHSSCLRPKVLYQNRPKFFSGMKIFIDSLLLFTKLIPTFWKRCRNWLKRFWRIPRVPVFCDYFPDEAFNTFVVELINKTHCNPSLFCNFYIVVSNKRNPGNWDHCLFVRSKILAGLWRFSSLSSANQQKVAKI